ncbi:decaprenyl-phosphate phosphoribosyltransferase [bacterium BMS3Bbin11]|nr:decaprenyl-phosphate phosphoribosyltransferase [bacterium BMS3Abin11]GBE45091.1 decaprenyl-phosphate phosphoribosyltransferase [bacterium BMS3Bbin11]HDH15180.1 prenyltransferase [Gammaproteobacteria bacterium]HDZ79521.1 prenyltransferase [Gammaproteobacteria bacterium]
MLPGIVIALYLDHGTWSVALLPRLILAFLLVGLVASSYYVLNEVLDAETDKKHPVKCKRPVPSGRVNIKIAYLEWLLLGAAGVFGSLTLGPAFFTSAAILWLMGCIYNIKPVRTKDRPYLDVLSESLNNPLRLLLGWYATGTTLLTPISLVFAYWMIGAFFMAVKRFAEYRHINDPVRAGEYRLSFRHYNEERLLISIVYYVAAFGLFFGIFLIRYRTELILSIPLIAAVIAWYIHIGFHHDSPVQYPEKLYKNKGLMTLLLITTIIMIALMFIDLPWLNELFSKTPAI